jgi:tetratricopeptide (TPR) repeat protein
MTLARVAVMVCLLVSASAAAAQAASDFYVNHLRRGIASVQAGRSSEAIEPLRIAAFGLVDSAASYQTAQIYLTLAFENLERREEARNAAQRVVAAERVGHTYGSSNLPAAVRSDFQRVAAVVLSASDVQLLTSSPAAPPPAPPRSTPPSSVPAASTPPPPAPAQRPPSQQPAATPQTVTSVPKPVDVPARLGEAARHLEASRLAEARRVYRDLLALELDHTTLLRIGEGLYRARDFHGALDAFQRIDLRPGEEPYRYYVAVSLYETGDYAGARRELAAALPFIEVTPDVERYRGLINARN